MRFSFLDIDHFKSINDRYGHNVGDCVLCQFAGVVKAAVRSTDYLGRWGGEEFMAVLPLTHPSEGLAVAERARHQVAQRQSACEGSVSPSLAQSEWLSTLRMLRSGKPWSGLQTQPCTRRSARDATKPAPCMTPNVLTIGMANPMC